MLLDDLFICDACDKAGAPRLMRSYWEPHHEGHHLIRCQDPRMSGDTEREMSMEGRLNGMQTQLDDLTRGMGDHNDHMGDLNDRVGDLNGRVGDLNGRVRDLTRHTSGMANLIVELTGSITSLTSRIAAIEEILNRLAGAGTANGSV